MNFNFVEGIAKILRDKVVLTVGGQKPTNGDIDMSAYALKSTVTTLVNGANMDTLLDAGDYAIAGATTITNLPAALSGYGIFAQVKVATHGWFVSQEVMSSDGQMFIRTQAGDPKKFTDWKEIGGTTA